MLEVRNALVEVTFELEVSEVHEQNTESISAEPIGPDRYRLQSTPMYAYGYSHLDVVEAKLEGEKRIVRRLVAPAGHSTYRIIIAERRTSTATFDEHWKPLASMGCCYMAMDERYIAVDVPPAADINEVYGMLEEGESEGVWYFEEANCGHPLG
jgi:hypothetical protein